MNSIIPPFLKPGDTIGIAATARWITLEQLQPALDLFHSWGFKTKVAGNIHTQLFQLAGDDDLRASEMQKLMDDDEVKAIIIARGGYGTVRVIDKLDFTSFVKKPKWICGYSDITVLHTYLNTRGVATIHSTMPISFSDATAIALDDLRLCLVGEKKKLNWNTELESSQMNSSHSQMRNTKIIGGNLSVIQSLIGSNCLLPTENYVLFIEDVDEMRYHIDRMMMTLKRAGMLDNVWAFIVGGMTQIKDNTAAFGFSAENEWGFSAEEIVQKMANELNVCSYFNFPAGHQNDNRAFYLGMNCSLIQENKKVMVEYHF